MTQFTHNHIKQPYCITWQPGFHGLDFDTVHSSKTKDNKLAKLLVKPANGSPRPG